MIRKTLMATELAAMFALYHQPRPDNATFELLVTDWSDVLDDLTEAEFLQGMKAAKRVCKFLPVPADVLKAVAEQRRSHVQVECLALPEDTMTREERFAYNRKQAQRILNRIRGENTGGPVRADFSAAVEAVGARQ